MNVAIGVVSLPLLPSLGAFISYRRFSRKRKEQQRHELSWEAATQRFIKASDLNRLSRADSNLSKKSGFASSFISVGKNLEDMFAYIHFLASGFEGSRTAFGAIPGSLQPNEELCRDLGLTLKTLSRKSLKED